MARSEFTVTVHANVRLVTAWLGLMAGLAPVLGPDRAYRWGVAGAYRLILVKVGDRGRWQLGVPRD